VPIQKNTEREIFDYIDLKSMKKLLSERWFTQSLRYADDTDENQVNDENINETTEEDLEDEEMRENNSEEDLNEEFSDEESDQESWMWENEESQEELSE
jgi:hypothetical protein